MQSMAHPLEIRERAVKAIEEKGQEKADVVMMFAISLASLNRWLKQKREHGHLEIGKPPGAPAKLGAKGYEALAAQVKARPDATLAERCELLLEQGHERISRSTMQRMLARLAMTRKKNLLPPQTRRAEALAVAG
jgi:transposase